MVLLSVIVTVFLVLILLYFLGKLNHDFFEKQDIPFVKPWPFLGIMAKVVFRQQQLGYTLIDAYNQFPKARFFGMFDFMKPVYVIKDPELIKEICIKDFDHFINHRAVFDEDLDPLFARNLFSMHDTKWRNMRAILSPAFTGSKMRLMFGLITDYCETATETIAQKTNNGLIELEMKDLFCRFGNDMVASCAFGIEINSLKDENNEFYRQGKILTNLEGVQGLKFLGYSSFPKLMKFLKISLFSDSTMNFFREIISKTIKFREESNIVRHDMINLLLQAKHEELKFSDSDKQYEKAGFATVEDYDVGQVVEKPTNWSEDDITAQCLIFFFGGFDTASSLASFLSHELAMNPDIHEKLQKEVDEVKEELNGEKLTYEVIQNMKYMDMVVCETLRKWPQISFIDRKCNKPYVMEDFNGRKVHLSPGDGLWVPVLPIHYDPQYFPNPTKFDPERFSNENKGKIDPATFLTFGIGPRNCIGSRFALMQCKAVVFHILSRFYIETSAKTQIPLQLKKSAVMAIAENGFWLNFRLRN